VHRASAADLEAILEAYPTFSITSFPASCPREMGLEVLPDPLPEDPSHAIVKPSPSKPQAKKIALECKWVVLRRPDEY
jgi:hypothetical protein